MNIKILEKLPEHLTIRKFLFGSRVYGTWHIDSDWDYLNIIAIPTGRLVLQHASDTGDEIYTDIDNFYQCLQDGSQPVFFEVAHQLLGPDVIKYYTYENAKCYLGFAKRDLKFPNRAFHINRCIWMAEHIMRGELIDLSKLELLAVDYDYENLRSKIKILRDQLNKQFKKT